MMQVEEKPDITYRWAKFVAPNFPHGNVCVAQRLLASWHSTLPCMWLSSAATADWVSPHPFPCSDVGGCDDQIKRLQV